MKYEILRYDGVWGFISRDQDVCHLVEYDEVREGLRLDYDDTYPVGGNEYGYIKFRTTEIKKIEIPYGVEMQGNCTEKPPCTRNGFLGSSEDVIPEWYMQDGAELHEVKDGTDNIVAVYQNGEFKKRGGKE